MNTAITYTNTKGESMAFGVGGPLHYLEHELRDWGWSYSTGAASGRVTSFSRGKASKLSFPVGIAADTEQEGVELRNRLLAIGEADIAARTPGRLSIGEWYLPCWIIGGEPTNYWMDDRYAEFDLTLLAEELGWVRETELRFVPETGPDSAQGSLDFRFDFPFEFKRERLSKVVPNDGMGPCRFLWRVYGPATNPYIRIGPNLYKVNVDVPAGARLEVDARESAKTVTVIGSDGSEANAYDLRERGMKGSGSYIFEPVREGDNVLSWDNTFAFDIVLYHVSSAAPYERI